MTSPEGALAQIPVGLRTPLLAEYASITQNYAEHRWRPSELSGGRFCEVVYSVVDGHGRNNYGTSPSKPQDFPTACRKLEQNKHVPRSFQILIPRALPVLYEIRNQRDVGHVGGDVNSNQMDATIVLCMSNWIMCELVRVFHSLGIQEAQHVVDGLSDRRIALVWEGKSMRRVLDPSMPLWEQMIILAASRTGATNVADLLEWTGYANKTYLRKTLREFHSKRWIELSKDEKEIEVLPPGSQQAAQIIARRQAQTLA